MNVDVRKYVLPLLTIVAGVGMYLGVEVDQETQLQIAENIEAAVAAVLVAVGSVWALWQRFTGPAT